MTKEHAWPNWLLTLFPPADKVRIRQYSHNHELREWDVVGETPITVKRVCANCNGGWMSELENQAKPLLEALVPGVRQFTLSTSDQATLERWCLKTAMIHDASKNYNEMFFKPKDFARIRDGRRPNVAFHIFLAQYAGRRYDMSVYWASNLLPVEGGGVDGVLGAHSFESTCLIGRFVFQLVGVRLPTSEPGAFLSFMSNLWLDYTIRITVPPSRSDAPWPPPKVMDDERLLLFSRRVELELEETAARVRSGVPLDAKLSRPRDDQRLNTTVKRLMELPGPPKSPIVES